MDTQEPEPVTENVERKRRTRVMSEEALKALEKAREKSLAVRKEMKIRDDARREEIKKEKAEKKMEKTKKALKEVVAEVVPAVIPAVTPAVVKPEVPPEIKIQKKKDIIKEVILETKRKPEEKKKLLEETLKPFEEKLNMITSRFDEVNSKIAGLDELRQNLNKTAQKTPKEVLSDIFERTYQERLERYKLNMIRRQLR